MHACHGSVNFKLYPTKNVNVNEIYLNGYMNIYLAIYTLKHM
jgi:hypothetical protein